MNWNLSEAKNRLSEVLTRAATEGPQTIRRRGENFVLLREAEFEKLSGPRPTFKDWLLNGPSLEGLDVPSRDRSVMREVEL
jgi:antitoxin Phd